MQREVGAERPRSVAAHQFARKRGAGRMRVASRERSVHVAARTSPPTSLPAPTPSGRIRCMYVRVYVCVLVCLHVCMCEQPSVMRSNF